MKFLFNIFQFKLYKMRTVSLMSGHKNPNASFSTTTGIYFNVLYRTKNNYVAGYYYSMSGCRDSLCSGLITAYHGDKASEGGIIESGSPLYKGKASILVGGSLAYSAYSAPPLNNEIIQRAVDVLHHVEEQLKVPTKSKFYPSDKKGFYVARIDPYWVQRTYLLSLWALFVRMSMRSYTDTYTSPQDFLDKYNADYWNTDYNIKAKYKKFVDDGTYITPFNENGYGNRHFGIMTVKVPGVRQNY